MPTSDWPGREIAAPDGTAYGRLDELFVGRRSGAPEFGIVTVAREDGGTKQVAVPMDAARVVDERVVLPLDPARVRAAPEVREQVDAIPPESGRRVREFFGLDAAPTTPMDPVVPPGDDAAEVVRHEERVEVRTERRPAERVRVRKRVVTEEATITVTLRREELVLEREPVEPGEAGLAAPRDGLDEGEQLVVVLHAEEPVVTTRVVPVERVRLHRDSTTEDVVVRTPVTHEEVDVEPVPTTEEHPA